MATSAEGTDIREGLLCPICMQDLGSVGGLLSHFEEAHNSQEEKDVVQSFKDFLGKAKKILKSDNPFNLLDRSQGKPSDNSRREEFPESSFQELGATRSHWSDYRRLRSERMDYYAAQTNKLIIRLDKIISYLPSEAGKRREHEQSIVSWVNDEDVKLCPQCAKAFNVLRRKHHCRVCGTIQCHQCSQFILLSLARKLTNPSYVPGAETVPTPPERLTHSAFNVLKRTGSNASLTSLTSIIDPGTGEGHIRVCNYCKQLLERREQQMDSRTQKAPVVELYEEMRKFIDKATELLPTYLKMVDSLYQGESTYSLQDAQDCRMKLLKIAEYVDGYSKKTQSLGLNDEKNPTSGPALSLQLKIRLSAVNFLKDNLLGLPNLPAAEELAKLQEERRQTIGQRIAQERMAVTERREQDLRRRTNPYANQQEVEAVSVDRGWGVETQDLGKMADSDDPMLQQMQIIRNYIQQARRAHRYDEVAMLEANLRDLQLEHGRMQSGS